MLDQKLLSEYNRIRKTKNNIIFCHAPFIGMNFEPNGNVIVCCYNRTFLLGTYPDDSLSEIWYGSKAGQFRQSMQQNVLPAGCEICSTQFQSKNFAGLRARSYDRLAEESYPKNNGRFLPMPKVMEFEISNICNLECIMCNSDNSSAIRKNREHLAPLESPYDDGFVQQLEAFIPHLTEVRFSGGEPFLIETYYQIWDLILRRNPAIEVSITTNGTILNKRVREVLEQLKAHIIVSIDSLEAQNFERIRINARFDQVMENVQYFRDYVNRKTTHITFAVCPIQQNWRELPHFLEFCNTQGIRLFFNTVLWPEDLSLRCMGYNTLGHVVEHLQTVDFTEDTEIQRDNNANYRDLIQQILGYQEKAYYDEYLHYRAEDLSEQEWRLHLREGNVANLVFPSDDPEAVRIAIEKVETEDPWDIQINKEHLSVKSNHRYLLSFRARADRSRDIGLGIAKAYKPWNDLGWYSKVDLTPEWQSFQEEFVLAADDDNARILFDVGNSDVAVELSDVRLRSLQIDHTVSLVLKRYLRSLKRRLHFKEICARTGNYAVLFLYQLQLFRLRFERLMAKLPGRSSRPRVMATVCWGFPIYSHTFVYQELTQLIRHGFEVRFLYFHLNSQQHLPAQFNPLWHARRRGTFHPSVCKHAFAYFQKRMPEKIESLTELLCKTSGMSSSDLHKHHHFIQAFSFARMVEAHQPDYLHTYFFYEGSLFALIAAYLLNIPRGVSCYADHLVKDYALKLVPLHLEQCKIVIATSKRIKQELLGIAPQVDPDRIIVKPNAINAAQFPAMNCKPPEHGQPYRLVCVSRIESKKGLIYLVEAVRILHDQNFNVELHLIGGIDDNTASQEYAWALNTRIEELKLGEAVHLEGRQSESEIKRFFTMSHMFVAPFVETEYGDKDGIPTSILEAMASGLPVVATDAGSIGEVIEDGYDGMLVPQRDPNALAAAIADLINNRESREWLGKNAAAKIRAQFDVNVCEHIFHDRLLQVLESRRTPTN